MGVLYRCQDCNRGIDVITGTAGFPGMQIGCPACGGEAIYSPSGAADVAGECIRIHLDSTTEERQPIPLDADDAEGAVPTVRVSAVEDDLPPTRPNLSPRHAAPTRPHVQVWGRDRPSPQASDKGRRGGERTDVTPMGTPSLAFAPVPPDPSESVTRIREVDVKPAPERPPQAAAPPPGSPAADIAGRTPRRKDRKLRGLEDKTWSISEIRKALKESGWEDSSDRVDMSAAAQQTGPMGARLAHDKQLEVKLPGVGGVPLPSQPDVETHENVKRSAAPPQPDAVELGLESTLEPPARSPQSLRRRSGVADSVLYQERHRARQTVTGIVCAIVIAAGVAGGYVWYAGSRGSSASMVPAADPDVVALAGERASRYTLEPIDFAAPFVVISRPLLVDYPDRVVLRLDLTNRSARPISGLHVSGVWHLAHDLPAQVPSYLTTYDRTPSVTAPLEDGETVTAVLEWESELVPMGDPVDSFLWIRLTAAGSADMVFQGPIAMVDVPF